MFHTVHEGCFEYADSEMAREMGSLGKVQKSSLILMKNNSTAPVAKLCFTMQRCCLNKLCWQLTIETFSLEVSFPENV